MVSEQPRSDTSVDNSDDGEDGDGDEDEDESCCWQCLFIILLF